MEPNQPDVEKLFASLGMDSRDFSEPSLRQKLEAMRTAIAFMRIADRNNLSDLLSYWVGLDDFEQAYAVGALSQLATVGVHAMAALGDRDFDGQLQVMEAELATVLDGGQG